MADAFNAYFDWAFFDELWLITLPDDSAGVTAAPLIAGASLHADPLLDMELVAAPLSAAATLQAVFIAPVYVSAVPLSAAATLSADTLLPIEIVAAPLAAGISLHYTWVIPAVPLSAATTMTWGTFWFRNITADLALRHGLQISADLTLDQHLLGRIGTDLTLVHQILTAYSADYVLGLRVRDTDPAGATLRLPLHILAAGGTYTLDTEYYFDETHAV